VQTAYNSSQQELEVLQAAALEICQEVEEGVAQAGSSLASRLRALGGHVSQRMRRALHLGFKKAIARGGVPLSSGLRGCVLRLRCPSRR
jgi:hypothetical protein